MGALLAGISGVIWANIVIVLVILGFFGGQGLAALLFLASVFATPFVLNKIADIF